MEEQTAVRRTASIGQTKQDAASMERRLPADVFEVIVNGLTDALVLDYRRDADAMVDARRRKGDDARKRTA